MLRYVNSADRTMNVGWATRNFNLTRFKTVDYSLPIAFQVTAKDEVGRRNAGFREGAFRSGISE
jgi:hypothetical protein